MIFFSLREVISEIKSDSGFAANITVHCIAQRAEKICCFFPRLQIHTFFAGPGSWITINF